MPKITNALAESNWPNRILYCTHVMLETNVYKHVAIFYWESRNNKDIKNVWMDLFGTFIQLEQPWPNKQGFRFKDFIRDTIKGKFKDAQAAQLNQKKKTIVNSRPLTKTESPLERQMRLIEEAEQKTQPINSPIEMIISLRKKRNPVYPKLS